MSMMGNGVQDKVHVVCMCLAASGGEPSSIAKLLVMTDLHAFMLTPPKVLQRYITNNVEQRDLYHALQCKEMYSL